MAILNHSLKLKRDTLGYKFQMKPSFPLQINNFKHIYFYIQKLSRFFALSQGWTKTLWLLLNVVNTTRKEKRLPQRAFSLTFQTPYLKPYWRSNVFAGSRNANIQCVHFHTHKNSREHFLLKSKTNPYSNSTIISPFSEWTYVKKIPVTQLSKFRASYHAPTELEWTMETIYWKFLEQLW